jgi:transmembrane sensor
LETGAISDLDNLEPGEAAAYWHARIANGADARAELEFERWREASTENREAYDRLTSRHDRIRALADVPEMLSMRHQTLLRLSMKQRQDKRVRTGLGVALAMLVVAAPVFILRFGVFAPAPPIATADSSVSGGQSFRTAVGQRSTITLADGSRVTLNTASRIRVAYSKGERQLLLDEGQAWFEVAKDSARPFIVHAGGQRVEAHGTAFDVRVLGDRTEVMLAEGRVTVDSERPGRSGASVAMKPNELLVASASGTTVNRVTNPDAWKNWRQGIVIFDNMPLARAVGEMNRYSATQLLVADAATGRIAISGGFNAGATGAFVEALAVGFGVRSRKDAAGNIVLSHVR